MIHEVRVSSSEDNSPDNDNIFQYMCVNSFHVITFVNVTKLLLFILFLIILLFYLFIHI